MLAKDNIKIKYSQEGYLPNYPPHLISDEEMFEAFLTSEYAYFYDNYPLKTANLSDNDKELLEISYSNLINAFRYFIARHVSSIESWRIDIPDWVYSYMLGEVVTDTSIQADRHYLLVGLNTDNIEDEITPKSQLACYHMSKRYTNKLDRAFKEDNISHLISVFDYSDQIIIQKEFEKWGVEVKANGWIDKRPPTMFGESHIIKLIRLNEIG